MNSFKKILFFILFFCIPNIGFADNHSTNAELVEKAKEITKTLETKVEEEEEDVPLNDPFAGNESGSSMSNIPDGEEENEMSLYNFKLVGIISGEENSYISLVDASGEVITLSLSQYLGEIRLVDMRIHEAIFEKNDKTYMIIDFNNQIREVNEY